MKLLNILSIGLVLSTVGASDVCASSKFAAFAKITAKRAEEGKVDTETAARIISKVDSKELGNKSLVSAVKRDIENKDNALTQEKVLAIAPALADHLIPAFITESVDTLNLLEYANMQATLTDFANGVVINEKFTKFFADLKLTKKTAHQDLSAWLKGAMDAMFGDNGKYKSAVKQQQQLGAMYTMLRLLENGLNHVTDAGLLNKVYAIVKEQGEKFDLRTALQKAVGKVEFDGKDIGEEVANRIQSKEAKTFKEGVKVVQTDVLYAKYNIDLGLDHATSVNVAKAVVGGDTLETALRAHLGAVNVDGNNIKESVLKAVAKGAKLKDAIYGEAIKIRTAKFKSCGFDAADSKRYAVYMTKYNVTHKATLQKNLQHKTRFFYRDVSARVIDLVLAGMNIDDAKKQADTDSYKATFDRFKLPVGKAKAAAEHLVTCKGIMDSSVAISSALEAVLDRIDFENVNIKKSVISEIAKNGSEFAAAVKTVKVKTLTSQFEKLGLDRISSVKMSKEIVDGAKSKKQALSDHLKSADLKAAKYQASADNVAEELLKGANIKVAVQKAKVAIEKTWFEGKRAGLGLSPDDVQKAAEATVANKSNSRTTGLAKILKPVVRDGSDLTQEVATEMLSGHPSKYADALPVTLKAFWKENLKKRFSLSDIQSGNLANAYVDAGETDLDVFLATTVLGSIKRPGKTDELNVQIASLMVAKGYSLEKAKKAVFVKKIKAEIEGTHAKLKGISSKLAKAMYEGKEKDGHASDLREALKAHIADFKSGFGKPTTTQVDQILKAVYTDMKSFEEAFSTAFLGATGGLVKAKYTGLKEDDILGIAKLVQADTSADNVEAKIAKAALKHLYATYRSKLFAKWDGHLDALVAQLAKGKTVDEAIDDAALEKAKSMLVRVLGDLNVKGDQKIRPEEFKAFAENYIKRGGIDFTSKSIEDEFKVYLVKGCGIEKEDLDYFYGLIKQGWFFGHRSGTDANANPDAKIRDWYLWGKEFQRKQKEAQAKAEAEAKRKAARAKAEEEEKIRRAAAAKKAEEENKLSRVKIVAASSTQGFYGLGPKNVKRNAPTDCGVNHLKPVDQQIDLTYNYLYFKTRRVKKGDPKVGEFVKFTSKPAAKPRYMECPQDFKDQLKNRYRRTIIKFVVQYNNPGQDNITGETLLRYTLNYQNYTVKFKDLGERFSAVKYGKFKPTAYFQKMDEFGQPKWLMKKEYKLRPGTGGYTGRPAEYDEVEVFDYKEEPAFYGAPAYIPLKKTKQPYEDMDKIKEGEIEVFTRSQYGTHIAVHSVASGELDI